MNGQTLWPGRYRHDTLVRTLQIRNCHDSLTTSRAQALGMGIFPEKLLKMEFEYYKGPSVMYDASSC
jgi:hypothetical protein